MIILHVSTPASWRGGEQQVANLATILQQQNIEQVLLCPAGSALATRMMKVSVPVATFASRGILNLKVALRIKALCTNQHFDIIHCHDAHAHTAAVLCAAFLGNKVPIIVSRRVYFPVSGSPLSKWKYNHSSICRIICVSNAVMEMTSPSIKNKSVLCVVHSGIDPAKYLRKFPNRKLVTELKLSPSAKIVGCLGALDRHKDYPTFLRAAASMLKKDPALHFIIAGKGDEERNIHKLIGELNLRDHVHLLGFREDVADVLQSLDLFMITTVAEGLGTIILEAFAAGIPVVATRIGGIPEMVEDGVTGLLAEPRDAESFSTAALRILHNPEFTKQLTDNALARVEDFSFEATAQKTLDIYRTQIL
jgi:L-malate glycosyltransferase